MRISDWSSDVCSSDLPLASIGVDGVAPLKIRPMAPVSRPRKLVRPAVSVLSREVVVLFCTFALSWILTFTVRMSPTLAARWSLKNWRAPGRHSELAWRGATSAAGIGMLTGRRSEEHTSELPSLMRISYAVFCLKKKKQYTTDG